MKIYVPNISSQSIGGGWTFLRNFQKALEGKATFVTSVEECDVYFITSVTMVDKAEVFRAQELQKRIVLRVDNMPRMSRNRRQSPHLRMRVYANMAHAVVYQSKWAKEWIGSYVGFEDKAHIIYNGVDTETFYPRKKEPRDYKKFLFVKYNRDENKRDTEAFDMFTEQWLINHHNELYLVGRFSDDIRENNFDFFRGENVTYLGVLEDRRRLAAVMGECDVLLYPSYSDACPNTVIEARACGMQIWHNGHSGVPEAATIEDPSLERMAEEYLTIMQ